MSERSDIIVILDRSGSMQTRRADHEGGLRSFLADAQRLAGDVRLTFVRFDSHDPCEVVLDAVPVADIRPDMLTLIPRGGTPLLDAVGETLTRYAAKCGEATTVVIITDGEENESRSWKKGAVQDLIKAREAAGWRVLYLGANVDAFAEAGALGVSRATTLDFANTRGGTASAYHLLSQNVSQSYSARSAGASWLAARQNLNFTDSQRKAAREDDDDPTAKTGVSQ